MDRATRDWPHRSTGRVKGHAEARFECR